MKKLLTIVLILISTIVFAKDFTTPLFEINENVISKISGDSVIKKLDNIDNKKSIKITYPKYITGKDMWPSAVITDPELLKLDNQSNYSAITCKLYNPTDHEMPLFIRLDTTDKVEEYVDATIPAKTSRELIIGLDKLTNPYLKSKIKLINFVMTIPDRNYTVYISDFKLLAEDINIKNMFIENVFNKSNVSLRQILPRNAEANIEVLDKNKVLCSQNTSGRLIDFTWNGLDKNKEKVKDGNYKIICKIKDPVLNKTIKKEYNFTINNNKTDLVFWNEPSTKKIMPFDRPNKKQIIGKLESLNNAKPIVINMAKNEFEATQLIALSNSNKYNLDFKLDKLINTKTKDEFDLSKSSIRQVGYVDIKELSITMGGDAYMGWNPDLLLNTDKYIVNPNEPMPIFVQLKSFKDTVAGKYAGNILVYKDKEPVGKVPLVVNVYNTTLPDSKTFETVFAYHNIWTKDYYKDKWSKELDRKYKQFIADHRIDPDQLYKRYIMDKTEIDDLEYFAKKDQLNMFSLYCIDTTSEQENIELAKKLDPVVDELKKRGIWDKAYLYGYDEAYPELFDKVKAGFKFFKDRYNIKTMATVKDKTYGEGSRINEIDIWVPLTDTYNKERANIAEKKGRQVWTYTCLVPEKPYANLMIENPGLDQRIIPWQMSNFDIPGFLFYSINWWEFQKEPLIVDGNNRTNWVAQSWSKTNGDGCLIAGDANGPVSTIRLENFLDGIEDYELLKVLAKKDNNSAKELTKKVSPSFTKYIKDDNEFLKYRLELLKDLTK